MISPTDLLHPSPAPHFKTFQVFLICCPKHPSFSAIQNHAPNVAFMGTLCILLLLVNLKTRVLCCSWCLNLSIIKWLSYAGDFSFYYIDIEHPPTPICSQGYGNSRYKPLLPLWPFTARYREHFISPPN